MKKIFLSLILSTFGMGCVKNVEKVQERLILTDGEREELAQHCEELSEYGDFVSLTDEINRKTENLLQMLEDLQSDDDTTEAYELSEHIRGLIAKAKMMLGEKYKVRKWSYELLWKIDRSDFDDLLGARFRKGFRMTKLDLVGASILGERDDDLLKNLTTQMTRETLAAQYLGKGSSLELCQLSKTRIFMIDIHYKNIINHNYRRFNLISR
ncbi:MAG: hypothetical protein OHK0056_21090 [Bacteriovoracaceae bacterium]